MRFAAEDFLPYPVGPCNIKVFTQETLLFLQRLLYLFRISPSSSRRKYPRQGGILTAWTFGNASLSILLPNWWNLSARSSTSRRHRKKVFAFHWCMSSCFKLIYRQINKYLYPVLAWMVVVLLCTSGKRAPDHDREKWHPCWHAFAAWSAFDTVDPLPFEPSFGVQSLEIFFTITVRF